MRCYLLCFELFIDETATVLLEVDVDVDMGMLCAVDAVSLGLSLVSLSSVSSTVSSVLGGIEDFAVFVHPSISVCNWDNWQIGKKYD